MPETQKLRFIRAETPHPALPASMQCTDDQAERDTPHTLERLSDAVETTDPE